jgi:hypothetical protein
VCKTIEIHDRTLEGALKPELVHILNLLSPEADLLCWSVLELQAEAKSELEGGLGMLELEATIAESPKGLVLTWEELKYLASQFFQVFDAVIVGCRDEEAIPVLDPNVDLTESCEIVVVMFDSSFWEISSRNVQILNRLEQTFEETTRR